MPSVIVARKTVNEVIKILDGITSDVTVGLSETRIEFSFQSDNNMAVLTSRLVDGTYIDYEVALSVKHTKKIILNTKEFKETIDRVATVSTDRVRSIRLRFEKGKVTLLSTSLELGSAVDEIDINYDYDEIVEIGFNVRYLLDIVSQINTDHLEIFLSDPDSSVRIQPLQTQGKDSDPSVYMLMSMKI
jgi:DNA polymerase-3 subunit beta